MNELREVSKTLPTNGQSRTVGKSDLKLYDGNAVLQDIYAPEHVNIVNDGLMQKQTERIDVETATEKTPNESKFIKVRSNLNPTIDSFGHLKYPLAIYERNEAHIPSGEAFIADERTHCVAMTKAVCDALLEGRLIMVKD